MKTIVKTVTGNIRGKILRDIEGSQYLSFRGIPYAKPPIEKLRFKVSPFFEIEFKINSILGIENFDKTVDYLRAADCTHTDNYRDEKTFYWKNYCRKLKTLSKNFYLNFIRMYLSLIFQIFS